MLGILVLVGCDNKNKIENFCKIDGCNNEAKYINKQFCATHYDVKKALDPLITQIKNYPIDTMGKDPIWFTDIANWPSVKFGSSFNNGRRDLEWLVLSDDGSQATLISKYFIYGDYSMVPSEDLNKLFNTIREFYFNNEPNRGNYDNVGFVFRLPTKSEIEKLNWNYIAYDDESYKANVTRRAPQYNKDGTIKPLKSPKDYYLGDSFQGQKPNLEEYLKKARDHARKDIAEARQGMSFTEEEIKEIYEYAEEDAREDYNRALANVDKQYFVDADGNLQQISKNTKKDKRVRVVLVVPYAQYN